MVLGSEGSGGFVGLLRGSLIGEIQCLHFCRLFQNGFDFDVWVHPVPIGDQKQNMPRGVSALFLALMVTQETRKKKCALINRMGHHVEDGNG